MQSRLAAFVACLISTSASAQAVDFLAGTYAYKLTMSGVDLYGNPAPLHMRNDGFGLLRVTTGDGLDNLSPSTRVNRDTRVADFNGDGWPDVISNTYQCVTSSNDETARLYLGSSTGFTEDTNFRSLGLRGRGETIVVADFDNDADVDIFVPYYTFSDTGCTNSSQSYLLENDGSGHFADVAVDAGVSLPSVPLTRRPEGAQAADFDDDGWPDLYVASRLFINRTGQTGCPSGNICFIDKSSDYSVPSQFDEGAKFLDWNNDGKLDLVLQCPGWSSGNTEFCSPGGPALYEFSGTSFSLNSSAMPSVTPAYLEVNGINVADLNNDGREDIVVQGGSNCDPKVLINNGPALGFSRATALSRQLTLGPNSAIGLCNGQSGPAFADLNGDGRLDVLYSHSCSGCSSPAVVHLINNINSSNAKFVIEVVGPNGERNQFGRLVRVSPQSNSSFKITRLVDSGSGYMAQGQYPLLIGSSYNETHNATVTSWRNSVVTISFTISPGYKATVYAPSASYPSGRVVTTPLVARGYSPALPPFGTLQ